MQQRRSAFLEGIRELDAITLPTVAAAAPRLPVNEASPLPAYLTRPVNYLGLCALAQPSGLADGLPTSVQWVGKPFEEARILALGAAYERTCGHHRMRAPLEVEGSESSA
jgi:aspartyl-tRNA(Asn)/glutamyl-tRNA(Gln) amidotransferase subunit A